MYDFILKGGNIVDVRTEEIKQADVAVKDGKIAGVGHFSGENVIDCTGKYITPGFIDAHVHIESSMATPMEFSKAVMPHGTTTVIADPHELVNVKGNEAMEYILDAAGDDALVYRYGGDEFVIMFKDKPYETMDAVGKRVKDNVRALQIPNAVTTASQYLTVSQGYVLMQGVSGAESVYTVLKLADQALYSVKKNDKNGYCIYSNKQRL